MLTRNCRLTGEQESAPQTTHRSGRPPGCRRDSGAPMSLYSQRPTFGTVLRSFGSADGLPFADALSEEDINNACKEEGVDFANGPDDVYTPAVTLWAFIAQCLSASKSCVAAVARVVVLRFALGLPVCSAGTGGYCKARPKLPESLLQRLTCQV